MRPDYARLNELPAPASSRLIDFDRVHVITLESFPPQFVVVVSGTKPFLNMEVSLVPLIFVRQPEYWGIELVGQLPGGVGLPAVASYEVSLPLAGIIGTKGIEVIGATRTQRVDVPEDDGGEPATATVLELHGEDAQLTLRMTDDPQARELSFRDREHDRRFEGSEIRSEQSELGELLNVGLQDAPDDILVKLTLLLPPLNQPQSRPVDVETLAIVSTHRQSVFLPQLPEGQLTTYRTLPLTGSARSEAVSQPRGLVFSRDDRPVDGELRELRIVPEDGPTFAATLRTAHTDRVNQQEIDRTEELASGLACSITDAEVICSRDDRPVDGQLKELVVSQSADGTFAASLRTAFFDRINGQEVDETESLATGLTRA
ncbi:MAG: hypothetical protein M3N47_03035 [Chloroflexota bacterium]|nr:hypothetical protein [Chloroflexota bacterium]